MFDGGLLDTSLLVRHPDADFMIESASSPQGCVERVWSICGADHDNGLVAISLPGHV